MRRCQEGRPDALRCNGLRRRNHGKTTGKLRENGGIGFHPEIPEALKETVARATVIRMRTQLGSALAVSARVRISAASMLRIAQKS